MRLLLQLCFRHGPPPSAQDQTSFAGRPPPESAVSQDLWLSYTGSCFSWDSPFAIFFLFDGWFKMALLRYSSHSIEFNHFNCTFHIFFLYLHQVMQLSPQSTSGHFRYAEQKPCTLNWLLHRLLCVLWPEATTKLLSVSTDLPILFMSFKQNHVWGFFFFFFGDWRLSLSIFLRFIHVSVLLFFLRLNCKYIPHLAYIVMSCWIFGVVSTL